VSILLKNVNFIGHNNNLIEKMNDIVIDDNGVIDIKYSKNEINHFDYILELSNDFVSSGWIDLHTHIYYGVSNLGVNPDLIGPKSGVSILVDAGSAGEINFLGFKKYIIQNKNYPIFSFINVGSTGLMYANQISELDNLKKLNINRLIDCINNNKKYIKGLKIRASGVILRGWGAEIVKLAKKIAKEVNLPLMVHIGEPLPLLEDILPLLGENDIVTHCYHGKRWGILQNDKIIAEVQEALLKGVKFDVGHGSASFNYNIAEKAISKGLKPYTISTDLHINNINGPVWNLSLTMSKMLAVGLSIKEVIKCVTDNPASILNIENYKDGFIGKKARFTIFTLKDSNIKLYDSNGNNKLINKIFVPKYVILGNEVFTVSNNKFFKK